MSDAPVFIPDLRDRDGKQPQLVWEVHRYAPGITTLVLSHAWGGTEGPRILIRRDGESPAHMRYIAEYYPYPGASFAHVITRCEYLADAVHRAEAAKREGDLR